MIAVTGASGFVGRHVVDALRREGLGPVVPISRRRRDHPHMMSGDLADPEALRDVPWSHIDRVVHCAGAVPARSDAFLRDNVEATRGLLDRLDTQTMRAFVHLSSVAVYREDPPMDEVHFVETNTDYEQEGYGGSKRTQEELIGEFAGDAMGLLILRPSSIYGRGSTADTVLPTFVRQASRGEPLVVRAPRSYRQNFVHVRDVAEIVVQGLMEKGQGTFNLFSDETVDLMELAQRVVDARGGGSTIDDQSTDEPFPARHYVGAAIRDAFHHRFLSLRDGLATLPGS